MKNGTVLIEDVESVLLKDNPLGDPFVRKLAVYLPPSYRTGHDHFPVVYLLSGFMGFGTMYLSPQAWGYSMDQRCDRLIQDGRMQECIVVMPDCFTRYGGSQYVNSSAQGAYEDYIIKEIVPHVDRSFRTKTERRHRALMGKSSGGFGALRLGLLHPDLFSTVFCSSGDLYFEFAYLPDIPRCYNAVYRAGGLRSFLESFFGAPKKSKEMLDAINIIAMSASYSPNASSSFGFDLPFDEVSGELRDDIWKVWLSFDPVRMIDQDCHARAAAQIDHLFLECGSRDEYHLHIGARIFTDRLRRKNVRFWYEEFDDGHMSTSYRYDQSLQLVSQAIS